MRKTSLAKPDEISFNTTLVQLKEGELPSPHGLCDYRFNTTLVQLKASEAEPPEAQCASFNTTLVQLKVARMIRSCPAGIAFQYHTGPIKREKNSIAKLTLSKKVSIPHWSN